MLQSKAIGLTSQRNFDELHRFTQREPSMTATIIRHAIVFLLFTLLILPSRITSRLFRPSKKQQPSKDSENWQRLVGIFGYLWLFVAVLTSRRYELLDVHGDVFQTLSTVRSAFSFLLCVLLILTVFRLNRKRHSANGTDSQKELLED